MTSKDGFALSLFLLVYSYFVFFNPNVMGHPDNYIPANPLVTPTHIVPEWYFLPFYAILRSITFKFLWFVPAKLGGVLCMFASIALLALLPWLDTSKVRSARFRPMYRIAFWLLVIDCVVLGYIGGQVAEEPYVTIGQIATLYYFLHFLVILPVLGLIEKPLPLPKSISESVLGGGKVGATAAAKPMEKA
jgi:ubiquinol-cytochrome c reductase cytochrome b/c1 subunit